MSFNCQKSSISESLLLTLKHNLWKFCADHINYLAYTYCGHGRSLWWTQYFMVSKLPLPFQFWHYFLLNSQVLIRWAYIQDIAQCRAVTWAGGLISSLGNKLTSVVTQLPEEVIFSLYTALCKQIKNIYESHVLKTTGLMMKPNLNFLVKIIIGMWESDTTVKVYSCLLNTVEALSWFGVGFYPMVLRILYY